VDLFLKAPGIGVTCWPAPGVAANEDRSVGNLGLSAVEEADIVDFLGILTDGYTPYRRNPVQPERGSAGHSRVLARISLP